MEADQSAGGALGQARLGSLALLVLFFLSGLLSLVYQIIWSRLFYPVFGMNLSALTAVMAAFMGGLGLGAHLFGRLIDRANPWKIYALLEVGIGCFGLLIPHLTGPCGILFARLTPLGSPESVVHLVRFAGVTLLLAGPCLLMGGTFPAFVRGFSRSPVRLGRDLGSIYALNTLGAASGCLVAGVWLLPHLGMNQISYGAALGNFLLGLGVWLANPVQTGGSVEDATPRGEAPGAKAWALLGLLFMTGYLGLSFELLWTRALTQALGATYFSFSMILTAMLLGIFLGSALYRGFLADREGRGLLAGLTVLLFLAAALSFLTVAKLQPLLQLLRTALPLNPTGLAFFVVPPLALSLAAFLPTATLLGAIFPLCLRCYAAGSAHLGRDLGLAYGINTAGAVTGVVLTGLVTIEHLGSGGTLILLFILSTAAVCLAFLATTRVPRLLLASALALALVAGSLFPRDIFFTNQLACLSVRFPSATEVLFRGEDATSMATLVEMPSLAFQYVEDARIREGKQRNIFHSNWRGVGGTRIYLWNLVGAYLAGMLHPDPKEILVIGYGSGRQLKTLVSLPYLRRIDIVEVNKLNFAASDYFYLNSHEILNDPRVTVHVDDGRNHLLRSRRQYDVILVDVGGIEADGAEFFYTREFLELCRDHLRPGGLVFTWLDIRSVPEPLGLMYRRTLQEVFPGASVWLGSGEPTSYGWLWLVGSVGRPSIDTARLKQRWEQLTPTQRRELALAGLREPLQLASLHLTDLGNPPLGIARPRLLTDDRPYYKPIWELEYPPGPSFESSEVYAASLQQLLESAQGPLLVGASEEEREAVQAHRQALQGMARKGTVAGPFRLFPVPPAGLRP